MDILARLRRHALIELGEDDDSGLPMLRILPTMRLVTGTRVSERIRALIDAAEDTTDEAEERGEDAGLDAGEEDDAP